MYHSDCGLGNPLSERLLWRLMREQDPGSDVALWLALAALPWVVITAVSFVILFDRPAGLGQDEGWSPDE